MTTNKIVTLKRLKENLAEWFPQGTTEEIIPVKIAEYDKLLSIKENGTNEVIFAYLFEPHQAVADSALVSLDGIANEEFRGVLAKCIELDDQIAFYQNQNKEKQMGE